MKHHLIRMLCFAVLFGFCLDVSQADEPTGKSPKLRTLSSVELARLIDDQIAARWKDNGVIPANPASNEEFVRRVYLDVAGRIPRVSEVRAFLEDDSADKREKLIDSLLSSSQYVKHFSNTLGQLILPQQNDPRLAFFGRTFQQWVQEKVESNTPYDEMVRELLTSPVSFTNQPGQVYNSSANSTRAFYQANENKPENVAAAASRLFLGVRLECAQCHDHPFASWKRQQFWEFTAFFANVSTQRIVNQRQPQPGKLKLGEIAIPGTEKTAMAKFLDGTDPKLQDETDPRIALVNWMTSSENPYFARTAANRLWGHFFGSGLIDPVDDEPTPDNPPSHPELLKQLTEQFIAHNYDNKYLIRAILLSKTYQLSSIQSDKSQEEPRLFARMAIRGLTPEQLFDSLSAATGYQEASRVINGRVVVLNQNTVRSEFLNQFSSTDLPTEKQTSILQALSLMNGKLVTDATSLDKSQTLAAVVHSPFFTTGEKIETLFLSTLTRYPTEREMSRLSEYVQSGGPRQDPQAALADVYWALLNSSEFSLNH